jgi:hypothetical protein
MIDIVMTGIARSDIANSAGVNTGDMNATSGIITITIVTIMEDNRLTG